MRSGHPQPYSNFEARLDCIEPPFITNKNPSKWESTRVIYLCTQNNNVKSDCEKPIKIIYEKKTCTAVPITWYIGYREDYQAKFSHRRQLYPSQQYRFFLLLIPGMAINFGFGNPIGNCFTFSEEIILLLHIKLLLSLQLLN